LLTFPACCFFLKLKAAADITVLAVCLLLSVHLALYKALPS